MIVVFDASVLVYLIDANAKAPLDPSTGKPLEQCAERIKHLLASLQQQGAKIVIPTPALAEVLVKAGDAGPGLLQILKSSKHFRVAAFDERAAIEFAASQVERANAGKRSAGATRSKSKFDDQIVAIAAVEGATRILSDDKDISRLSEGRFEVSGVIDLPIPSDNAQSSLDFEVSRPDSPEDDQD